MIILILILTYLIGIPVWIFVEKKVNPYRDSRDVWGFSVDENEHRDNVVSRAVFWPIIGPVLIMWSIVAGVFHFGEKMYDYINKK